LSTLRKIKHPVIKQQQPQQQQYQQQQQYNMNDPLLDTKIEYVASGLIPHYSNLLHEVSLSNKENALTIISYINAMRTEVNLSDNYRMNLIRLLSTFSNQ
jgi:transcription initiation factor TFIID subunit TAF12